MNTHKKKNGFYQRNQFFCKNSSDHPITISVHRKQCQYMSFPCSPTCRGQCGQDLFLGHCPLCPEIDNSPVTCCTSQISAVATSLRQLQFLLTCLFALPECNLQDTDTYSPSFVPSAQAIPIVTRGPGTP